VHPEPITIYVYSIKKKQDEYHILIHFGSVYEGKSEVQAKGLFD
jgi:hypothetical protein